MKSSSQKREHVIIVPGGLLATSADADAGGSVAIKGGWRTGRRVWRPSQPDPRLEEARRRVFENGSERDDKTNETQVGELYRQIGQLKVENDFLRLGKEAGPRDDRHPTLSIRRQCHLLEVSRATAARLRSARTISG